jgi:hypothetical protein
VKAAKPERLLKLRGRVREQTHHLVAVVEVAAPQDALSIGSAVHARDVGKRVGVKPALPAGVVQDGYEQVAVLVARLRRRRRAEQHPGMRPSLNVPTLVTQRLGLGAGHAPGPLMTGRNHPVRTAAAVLPRTTELRSKAHRFLLGDDLDRLGARRARNPSLDRHLAHNFPRRIGTLGSSAAEDALGLEGGEVGLEMILSELIDGRVGTQIAVEPLEEILIVHRRRSLQPTLAGARGDPSVDSLLQRAFRAEIDYA